MVFIDVAPAQRDELALAQARERGSEEDGGVDLAIGGADERMDLLGADVRASRLGSRRGAPRGPARYRICYAETSECHPLTRLGFRAFPTRSSRS